MGTGFEQGRIPPHKESSKAMVESEPTLNSKPRAPFTTNSRANSMVVKKVSPREFIPPHIIAEAISTLRGLDLRWSGPITPGEMQYVEQYVVAKYPQYARGLVEDEGDDTSPTPARESPGAGGDKLKSPRGAGTVRDGFGSSSTGSSGLVDLERTQLEPSRLLDILTKKSSFPGSFVSVPEIQARNRVLRHLGLTEEEYLVLFAPGRKEAMMLVGESYPFSRGNHYMTALADEAGDCIREFAAFKDSKVIPAPDAWLDLRIKGSQLSQYFRRKCRHVPKGLFAYPAAAARPGARHSLHWVSEAHRNSWHVLLDATDLAVDGEEGRLSLALHRPDFVLCTLENTRAHASRITCLLVRRKSFDTSSHS